MSDAFRDAELLATAIDDGFAGRRSIEAAMVDYEQQRNAATLPIYELTGQFAALAPPSEEQQLLFGALRHNQEQTNRLFGAIVGTVPIPEFFAPENLGRIIHCGRALACSSQILHPQQTVADRAVPCA